MAVSGNISTQNGDIMTITMNTPLYGVNSFTGYTDDADGEVVERYFTKEFSYSINGLSFSDWETLSDVNLQAIIANNSDFYVFKFQYTHVFTGSPTDLESNLKFNSVSLNGNYEAPEDIIIFTNIFLSQLIGINDPEVLRWAFNVNEKLYEQGIIPRFIIRGSGNTIEEDRDYIDFWWVVAHYFALFVAFIRQFQSFDSNEILLFRYLKQRNLFFCEDMSLLKMRVMLEGYFKEIRKRGTDLIGMRVADDDSTAVDGELVRLMCRRYYDEFIFHQPRNCEVGWTVNRSSPLFKGLTQHRYLTKSYEDTEDIVDLNAYPSAGGGVLAIATDGDMEVMSIAADTIGEFAGISPSGSDYSIIDFTEEGILVDPTLDYEITFWVKQTVLAAHFSFGVKAFDPNKNEISCIDIKNGADVSWFFDLKQLNRNDKYYFIRGIIHSKDKDLITDDEVSRLNIGFGLNMRFGNNEVRYIIPVIGVTIAADVANGIQIWNLRVNPLKTPYNTCFVQVANFVQVWAKNRNLTQKILYKGRYFSYPLLEEIVRHYLLNYRNVFKINYIVIEEEEFAPPPSSDDTLLAVGDGTYVGDGSGVFIGY